jgi:hypothetical protein
MLVGRLKTLCFEGDLRWTKSILPGKDSLDVRKAFGFIAIELSYNRSFLLPFFRRVGLCTSEDSWCSINYRSHGVVSRRASIVK